MLVMFFFFFFCFFFFFFFPFLCDVFGLNSYSLDAVSNFDNVPFMTFYTTYLSNVPLNACSLQYV